MDRRRLGRKDGLAARTARVAAPPAVLGFPVPQDAPSELDALVARTAGAQPWRKVFHAVNAVVIAAIVAVSPWTDRTLLLALGGAVAALLVLDLGRLASPPANRAFFRLFGRLASPREARGIASSTWYAIGILAAVAAFPRPEAVAGILVLGLADPAAAWIGRTRGHRPFLGGTLEGSLAFFLTAAAILVFSHPWPAALCAAVAGALAERRSWPLDDNLTIPVVSAGVLHALGPVLS
jgi:dolichol kinase